MKEENEVEKYKKILSEIDTYVKSKLVKISTDLEISIDGLKGVLHV